jgi:catalase
MMSSFRAAAVPSALMLLALSAAPAAQAQVPQPQAQVDALEGLFGKHAGARRSGAKGVCATGYFLGQPAGQALSSAVVFNGERIPVVARFSVGGGNPKASDKSRSVRGLALAINHPGGQQWQMAAISAPVFFVAKPEQFAPFLQVRTPDPATGKPDADKLKAFNEANPETLRQAMYLAKAPVPASYGSAQYWSTNAFELVNAKAESRFARWQFVPEAGAVGLTDDEMKSKPDDFLADELRARVKQGPVAYAFQFQLAKAGDPITDPTQAWPADRDVVTAGRLVIDAVSPDMGGACEKMTFNPVVLPAGIKPSADPVLQARAAPYVLSLGRRLGEGTR